MFPFEHAVIDIGEDVMAAFKIGKPFSAYIVVAQGLVYRGEILQGVFNLIPRVTGAFLMIQEGGPIR
jgi:hypothetical protein